MNFNPTFWLRRTEAIPAAHFVVGAAAVIGAVGVADHFTGPMTALRIFYLLPVAATAWVAGPSPGRIARSARGGHMGTR